MRALLTFVFFFQFITAAVIIMNGSKEMVSAGGTLTTISFIVYVVLIMKMKKIIKKAMSFIGIEDSIENEPLISSDHENLYRHPVEIEEEHKKRK